MCEWRAFLFNVNFSVEFVLLGRFLKVIKNCKSSKRSAVYKLCRNEKRNGGTVFAKKEKNAIIYLTMYSLFCDSLPFIPFTNSCGRQFISQRLTIGAY